MLYFIMLSISLPSCRSWCLKAWDTRVQLIL